MIIKNNTPVGRWIFYKLNGLPLKEHIPGYSSKDIADLTDESQINYNSHEQALRNVEDKLGKNFSNTWAVPSDPASEFVNYYISAATVSVTGGTISPIGAAVAVPEGEDKTFSLISEDNYYLSNLTIDNGANNQVSAVTGSVSGTSTYTFTDVMNSSHIISATFSEYGS